MNDLRERPPEPASPTGEMERTLVGARNALQKFDEMCGDVLSNPFIAAANPRFLEARKTAEKAAEKTENALAQLRAFAEEAGK